VFRVIIFVSSRGNDASGHSKFCGELYDKTWQLLPPTVDQKSHKSAQKHYREGRLLSFKPMPIISEKAPKIASKVVKRRICSLKCPNPIFKAPFKRFVIFSRLVTF
jgi:hypothetical protein